MRILLVANGYPPSANGGVETYTFNLANMLVDEGHEVHVLCKHSDFARADFELQEEVVGRVQVTRIVNDFKQIEKFEQTYRSPEIEEIFRQTLLQKQPDLVHYNHLVGLSCQLPAISASASIPSLFMIHDFWLFCSRINLVDWRSRQCGGPNNGGDCYTCMSGGQTGWQAGVLRVIKQSIPFHLRQTLRRRLLLKGSKSYILKMHPEDFPARQAACMQSVLKVDCILSPSDFVRSVFAKNGYPMERIEILPLGVDRPTSSPNTRVGESHPKITFGFVGSLLPAKGVDVLLRAFQKLQNEDARLLIFGDEKNATPEYRQLLVETTRTDARIKFMGPFSQSQRTGVYHKMDVLVMPSRQAETFSLVAREALAHGRPVIAAESGALPEIISPGVNGLFFPPDDEAALLRCLEIVCSDPSWLHKFHTRSPEVIPFIDEHADRIEAVYRKIVGSPTSITG